MIEIVEGRVSNFLRKGINNVVNTYNYLAGDSDTRFNYKYKSNSSELKDTAFKDFMSIKGFKYDAKTDPDNGMVRVSFDATKVPTELADQIDPNDKSKLYKYVTSYKDDKVVMEFPMVSRMRNKNRRSNESVMAPIPTPYDPSQELTVNNEPNFLEVKTDEDTGEVNVENKDTGIYVMTDVNIKNESVDLNETPGLTLSSPQVKGSKLVIEINGKRYTYEVVNEDESAEDVAKSVSKMQKYSDGKALAYLKKHMKLVKEAVLVSSNFTGTGIDDLITDLLNATIDYLKSKGFTRDRATDLFNIDWHQDEDTILIEVRAEISDEDKEELTTVLDPLIINYDRESYFDVDSEGVLSAILYKENINPAMLESLKLENKYVGVEYTYDGDDTSDYLGHINVDSSDGEDRALEIAMDYVTSNRPEVNPRDFKITKNKYNNVEYLDKTGKVVNLKEGNSFKDHHICQGCGKPLSQCTCDVKEEDVDFDNLDEECTQSSDIGQHKTNSIDLVESKVDFNGIIEPGKEIVTKAGHKIKITKVQASISSYNGDPSLHIWYDYEKTDGEKGSDECSAHDMFNMIYDRYNRN